MSEPSGTPCARMLLTGDELLRGFIQDANSGFVAASLRDMGIELEEIRIVGDSHAEIAGALHEALRADGIDLVVVTGGLGPTHDDRTSEAVADALRVGLVLFEDALAVVEARVRAYGRMRTAEQIATFTPGNRKQATLPSGATWLDPLGTAPGYVVADADGRTVIVLPGPPSELRHAWQGARATSQMERLLARVGARHERLVRVWGVPESRASQVLAASGHEDSAACRVTICARDGELEIAVRGSEPAAVDQIVDAVVAELEEHVFALDDHRSIVDIVAVRLRDAGWRLGAAESCTGGMLGAELTSVEGSSDWFTGSLVTYANDAKVAVAGVDAATLAAHGAVSEEVAGELARGARATLGTQVGVGITGIAGPGGGSDDKPVGTVHVSIDSPVGHDHRLLHVPGDRATVRRRTCTIALHMLRKHLESAASRA